MKTQNLAAVAITTALSLTAVSLVVWQSRDLRLDTTQPVVAGDEGLTEPATTRLASPLPNGTGQLPIDDALTVQGDPPAPASVRERCKNGFSVDRDASGAFSGWTCNRSFYEEYTTESLEILAYGDAEAARVLAYRLRHSDYPRAIRMAQRTAALTGGETRTLLAAANWRSLTKQNGDPDLSGYGQAYVLHHLIERLKDSSYRAPPTYESRIRDLTTEPELVFRKLDAVVDRMYDEIRQIELDITGQSTIGGDEDA